MVLSTRGDAREVRTITLSTPGGEGPSVVHPGGRLAVIPQGDKFTVVDAEAAEDLTAVLAHFPEDAELYEQRAACYAAMGDKSC